MPDHRRPFTSRPLVTGVVAGCVLGVVWLIPSAYAGEDAPDPLPTEQQRHEEFPPGPPAARDNH